jgi:hypothetical protein
MIFATRRRARSAERPATNSLSPVPGPHPLVHRVGNEAIGGDYGQNANGPAPPQSRRQPSAFRGIGGPPQCHFRCVVVECNFS